jgi:hypothetical protein
MDLDKEKKKLDPSRFKMVSWDELDDDMKEKAMNQTWHCMMCGVSHKGLNHVCAHKQHDSND